MRLLLRRGNGSWAAPQVSGHSSEDALQELLATSPDLLPGDETGLPLAIARELPVSVGRIDLVGVDVEGDVTLCECKLATNPGVRREVIGQLLEYAGSLRGMSFDDFADRFEKRTHSSMIEAVSAIAGEGFDPDSFESQVGENLASGRFRLVVVVDQISEALRQTIVYLNDHLDGVVLALELAYLKDGTSRYCSPRSTGLRARRGRGRIEGRRSLTPTLSSSPATIRPCGTSRAWPRGRSRR